MLIAQPYKDRKHFHITDNTQGVLIEPIEREMIGFNNLIRPIYYPRTSIEDVDGKKVLVIWVPGGPSRPYKVPDEVTAKQKKR